MFMDTEQHRLFAEQRVVDLRRAARAPASGAGLAAVLSRLVAGATRRREPARPTPARGCPSVSTHP